MLDYKTFCHMMRQFACHMRMKRLELRIKQKDAAKKIGVNQYQLCQWENRESSSPGIQLLNFINWCEALGTDPGDVLDTIIKLAKDNNNE